MGLRVGHAGIEYTTVVYSVLYYSVLRYLELWHETPILWLACRHHILELHIKHVVGLVTGNTKDPGVSLFRRLKSTWHSIEVNYSSLNTFDYTSVPEWMEDQGKRVLVWAEQELQKKTWPRADYQELLQLLIICLGGEIQNFKFRLPGPDHHARWMSKCLYYLKMKLLKKQFMMTEQEQQEVEQITEFLVIFYIKAWFESPLPTSQLSETNLYFKPVSSAGHLYLSQV